MTSVADRIAGPRSRATRLRATRRCRSAAAAPAITLPLASERELRLDLFRGLALWLIFIDHLPPNLLTWLTIRNYGFSDATEIFIFISGYTAAFVYGRAMREAGFVVATARILRRVWQIYVAHVFLFTIFLAEISYVATSFENPLYTEEMGIMDFLKQPDITIVQALLLRFRPVNMDVLPLYIVLMLFLPFILWLMKWKADVTLALSVRSMPRPGNTISISRPIRTASGPSIRLPGNCCSCSAPGARRAARGGCRGSCRRRITMWISIAYLVAAFYVTLTWYVPQIIICCRAGSSSGCIRSTRPISTCCASRTSWRWRRSPCASCPRTGRGLNRLGCGH